MIQFYKQYRKNHFDMRCEITFDFENNIIHVLDTNESITTSVTNGIGFFYQEILADLDETSFDNFKWICYGTDGIPALYWNPGFERVPEELLYGPYQQRSLDYVNYVN